MDVKEILKKGLERLADLQAEDGSFQGLTFSLASYNKFTKRKSVFPSIMILSALNSLPESSDVNRIKRKIVDLLISEKSASWSFNYWRRASEDSLQEPYPDDLDDTFSALAGLYNYDPDRFSGGDLAQIINLLTIIESEEGGPYFTWLAPKDDPRWRDIDLAVNSNIGHFLSLLDISLDHLNDLVEKAIDDERYFSPYYASVYPVVYFISRFYNGRRKREIINYLLSARDESGVWGNPLDTALAVSSLINLGCVDYLSLKLAIDFILESEQSAWSLYPFVIERDFKSGRLYSGSEALTIAFCLESISKFVDLQSKEITSNEIHDNDGAAVNNLIVALTDKRFSSASPIICGQFSEMRNKILSKPIGQEITQISSYFLKAFQGLIEPSEHGLLAQLGALNLYGWMAYTIYDDFLDEEGKPALLSLGNLCLKEVALGFRDLSTPEQFELHASILNRIDEANAWEVLNCRGKIKGNELLIPDSLPDYGDFKVISDRSLGHALGAIALLHRSGFANDSLEIRSVVKFFRHYLLGKQLNDDAHDWEDDLIHGHLSPVAVLLIREWRKDHGESINLEKNLDWFRDVFWRQILVEVCDVILNQAAEARLVLNNLLFIKDPLPLEALFAPIEKSAKRALKEREEALEFLSAINK